MAAPYEKIPVYQAPGTVLPRRERIRRSAALMREDPVSHTVSSCVPPNKVLR